MQCKQGREGVVANDEICIDRNLKGEKMMKRRLGNEGGRMTEQNKSNKKRK